MARGESRLRAIAENSPVTPATRITVALIDRSAADLQTIHERTQLSKTDIVNRAISLYEFIDAEVNAGSELIIRRDGNDYFIKLL